MIIPALAQQPFASISNATWTSTGNNLPFWMTANQEGIIRAGNPFLNLTDVQAGMAGTPVSSALSLSWGARAVAGLGPTSYSQVNRAWAAIAFKGWELKGGLFPDTARYSGLSSTNGNLARSLNARPYPALQLSTGRFRPVPLTGGVIYFSALYSEGLLNDNRHVKNTRLHHKSFYLMAVPAGTLKIRAGFDHFVMWGGTSSSDAIGRMPQDFVSYLRYITGSRGGDDFPETDRLNVAGNQLGTWQLEAEKKWGSTTATFYLSHPFEDFSGVNWRNWPDNLMGIHLSFGTGRLIESVVYEYTSTMQQSARGNALYRWDENSSQWVRQEVDNYFNHGVYRSGFTYHRQVMASPLFFPVVVSNGISTGTSSTRFRAHHAGMAGSLPWHTGWKGIITYVSHHGTWARPYPAARKQVSALLGLHYVNPAFPVEFGLSAAADMGNTVPANSGICLSVTKRW